ncbi:penicillin-binding transpeptidase domain-containing protein [Kitasatospora sp. NPDC094015]|uniref:penicillin-binding transpeptidase domain-containing protein n=1 Tax=Kitasatospora sp. NPDC094015 TaxID=3155205 RepID=UPI00332398BC
MGESMDMDEEEPAGSERAAGGRRAVLTGIGVLCAAMLTVGGYGAWNLVGAVTGGSRGSDPNHRPAQASSSLPQAPTQAQADDAAREFLGRWAAGDLAAAAGLTDRPDAALAALTAFRDQVRVRSLAFTPSGAAPAPAAGQAGVGFRASVGFADTGSIWEYDGALAVARSGQGKPLVHWSPTVIHPHLGPGETIALQPLHAAAGRVTDRNGKALEEFPSLRQVLAGLPPAPGAGGDDGSAVMITHGPGAADAEPLFTVTAPTAATGTRLTLDADLQRAAEAALHDRAGGHPGSLVAIDTGTGGILAVANSPAEQFNRAFLGGIAPGSTMKVITAAALLEAGLDPGSAVPCPSTTNSPRLWHNDEDGDHLDNTLAEDFAESCNTAFIDQGLTKLAPGTLAKVAAEQFGVGLVWHTGVESFDATVPVPKNSDEQAAEYIGQGSIRANALTMASVAATVQSGAFHQPVLLAGGPTGDRPATAARKLPAQVATDLRSMMARTAAEGTAASAMAGISGRVGAKTGTAEVDGAPAANSWFIAYRDNVAVAAEIEGAGYGAQAAGQAVAQVLRAVR